MKSIRNILVLEFIILMSLLHAESIELNSFKSFYYLAVENSFFTNDSFFAYRSKKIADGTNSPDLFQLVLKNQREVFGGYEGLTALAGPIGNKVWVVVLNPIRSYLYDFITQTSERFTLGDQFIKENTNRWGAVPVEALLPYQNDIYYIQMQKMFAQEGGSWGSKIGIFNISSGQLEIFPYIGVMHAMSADKKYLLIDDDEMGSRPTDYELEKRDFFLYRISEQEKLIGYGHPNPKDGDTGDKDYGGAFIGNENVLIPCGSYPEGNYWIQCIGEPEKAAKLTISVDGEPVYVRFSPDFRWGLCDTDHGDGLVDATPLRDWLMTHNLLFKETTAKVTDTHIRVRENPNLQAKHMGFLEQGETVKVLDRSGPKETIDPWGEHPWYRIVRESDGLSGWCFGAFLDLAEEQGELRYKGEGMVTVYEE